MYTNKDNNRIMDFLTDDNIRMLCEIHEEPPLSFEMMRNYATLFKNQNMNTHIVSDDLLVMNKNFLIHLHLHYQSSRNVKVNSQPYTSNAVEYVNEYIQPIPPTPSFLMSTNEEEGLSEGPLNVLIQHKMKEREDELFTIRNQYNSQEESPESVKLIKISNILSDLPLIEESFEVENLLDKSSNTKKISIGDTTVFEYSENDPPNKTLNIIETFKINCKRINLLHIEYMKLINEMNNNISELENTYK